MLPNWSVKPSIVTVISSPLVKGAARSTEILVGSSILNVPETVSPKFDVTLEVAAVTGSDIVKLTLVLVSTGKVELLSMDAAVIDGGSG